MIRRWKALFAAALAAALMASAARAQTMTVDFYDMGKADATLVTLPDGATMLIDAGTNSGGKALVERFAREGIGPIDYMVITHFDKDHVGGADKIIEDVGVGRVLMPQYHKESKQYDQFAEALDEHPQTQYLAMAAGERMTLTLGGVRITISAAHREDYGEGEENDFSLAVRMQHGQTRFLFAGDAETPRQLELLAEGDVACDVLKVPYHGRLVDASPQFLAAASPQIAFIPDSEDDPASEAVVKILEELGAQVCCARDGGIRVCSDGQRVYMEQ